jgi:tetratricopeptide (TPR) repeat protein
VTRRALLFAASVLLGAPVPAVAEWREVRTDHFRVIGDVSATRLRDVALRFEQFRDVVTQLLPDAVPAASAPVVVIVFPDAQSYRPFMPMANARTVPVDGFFVDGADVNYITMNVEAGERAFPIVFHEFSHFLLNNAFPRTPLWFHEGLAEYFSTLEVTADGQRVVIGKPVARHVALLRKRRLSLPQLFAIDQTSKQYTQDGPARDLLYAKSWAVVHHARHAEPARFEALVWLARRLADGESADGSVRGTYAMPLDRLDADIQAHLPGAGYDEITLHRSVITCVTSEATAMDAAETDAWLADLLSHLQRGLEAIPRLERALQARADLPRALATLGVLRIRTGNRPEGLSLLEKAAAAGPDIETVQFEYGWALATDPAIDAAKIERARAALERALILRPGYPAATQMLASVYGQTGDFVRMRTLLMPLVKAIPDNQDAALQLAGAMLALGEIPAARALLGPILARPHDAEMRARARTLLGQISKLQARP